jgi:hypothetical protein
MILNEWELGVQNSMESGVIIIWLHASAFLTFHGRSYTTGLICLEHQPAAPSQFAGQK